MLARQGRPPPLPAIRGLNSTPSRRPAWNDHSRCQVRRHVQRDDEGQHTGSPVGPMDRPGLHEGAEVEQTEDRGHHDGRQRPERALTRFAPAGRV